MDEPQTDRFDYDRQGLTYSTHRSTDPHIARAVESVLADASTILNVGAHGTIPFFHGALVLVVSKRD